MDRAPYSDVRGIQKQAPEMDAEEERKDSFLSRRRFLFLGTPKANKDRRRFSSPGAIFLANMVRAAGVIRHTAIYSQVLFEKSLYQIRDLADIRLYVTDW